MAAQFYDKFPAEVRDFGFDASDILFNGDTIASVSSEVISAGIVVSNESFNGTQIEFRVSGGIEGTLATAAIIATLTSGQIRWGLAQILIKRVPAS